MKRSNFGLLAVITLLTLLVICVLPIMASDYIIMDGTTDTNGNVSFIPGTDAPVEDTESDYDQSFDTEYDTESVRVFIEDVTVDYYEGETYMAAVSVSGAPVSSFMLELDLPDFITVKEILFNEELLSAENAVCEKYAYDDRINVGYSSPVEFTDTVLFEYTFTVNSFGHHSGYTRCYTSQFVNIEAEELYVSFEGGSFDIHDPNMLMGDVNLDGKVALSDVMYLLRYIVGSNVELEFGELNFTVSDIDRNGELDMRDCQYIQNYLVGIIGSLDDITPECGHNNSERVHVQRPTCGQDGYYEYYCHDCGEYFVEPVPATGKHSYDFNGYCYDCGNYNPEYDQGSFECKHENKHEEYREDPTCIMTGYAEYRCYDCGEYFIETLYPTGDEHEFGTDGYCVWCKMYDESYICKHENVSEMYTDEPSCIRDGRSYYYCNDCYEEFTVKVIPATGIHNYNSNGECYDCDHVCPHDGITLTDSREATCSSLGYNSYKCDVCEMTTTEIVEMTEHKFNEEGVCVVCSATSDNESNIAYVGKIPNDPNGIYTQVLLYKNGTSRVIVSAEGESLSVNGLWLKDNNTVYCAFGSEMLIYSVEDSGELKLIKFAGYIGAGDDSWIKPEYHNVAVMGYSDVDENGNLAHNYADYLVYGKCRVISKEDIHHVLTVDNFIIETIYGDINGAAGAIILSFRFVEAPCTHENVTETENLAPTCGVDGNITYVCNDCEAKIVYPIPATGEHQYDENGRCAVCGNCQHLHYDKVYEKAPSCTDGYIEYECSVCGKYFSEDIPATGVHNYTCYGNCYDCDDAYSEEHVGVHKYDESGRCIWCGERDATFVCYHTDKQENYVREPTCEREGYIEYYCPTCDEYITETLPATGEHDYDNNGYCVICDSYNPDYDYSIECKHENAKINYRQDATCTEYGFIEYICYDCKEFWTVETEPMGHDYGEDGYCANCGDYNSDYDHGTEGEAATLYVYNFDDARHIDFYSDYTVYASFYTDAGGFYWAYGKWNMMDGMIYCYVEGIEYCFLIESEPTAEAPGTLILKSENGSADPELPEVETCKHELVEYKEMTEDGMTIIVVRCSICGYTPETDEPADPECDHSYGDDGYCYYCGDYNEDFVIEIKPVEPECDHSYGDDGYCYYCGDYNEDFVIETKPANPELEACAHKYDSYGFCVMCGTYNEKYDSTIGDDVVDPAPADCAHVDMTEQGYCPECGYQCDHSNVSENVIEATCTVGGAHETYCNDCNYYYVYEIAPYGHTVEETAIKNADGTVTYVAQCTRCGHTFSSEDTETPACDHVYGEDGYCYYCKDYNAAYDYSGSVDSGCADGIHNLVEYKEMTADGMTIIVVRCADCGYIPAA